MPILTAEECARIHAGSLEVLETLGIRVDDEGILALLRRHGARDGGDADTVRLPRELVGECLGTCPETARFADRKGGAAELGPGGPAVFWTGNALHLAEGRARRDLLTADLAMLTRVADACPQVDGMVGTSVADVPPAARDVVGFSVMAANTAKHLRPCIFTPAGATAIVEMAEVLAGGAPLSQRPLVSFGYSIVSPLHWSATGLGVFRNTAGHGLPLMINSEPMGGGTAPVTLAGCLVLANADALSGIVIGTMEGDLHDIGKNLVGIMLEGVGFEVIDLGSNVRPARFVEAVQKHQPGFVGFSTLLTTTMPNMGRTIAALGEAGLRAGLRVVIGGAPVTARFAREIGADCYAATAIEAAQQLREIARARR